MPREPSRFDEEEQLQMSLPDSSAGPLTVRDLLDLDRDPRPGAQHRLLTSLDTRRLQALDDKLTSALCELVNDREHGEIAALRATVRRIVALRKAKDTYALLLKQAV